MPDLTSSCAVNPPALFGAPGGFSFPSGLTHQTRPNILSIDTYVEGEDE